MNVIRTMTPSEHEIFDNVFPGLSHRSSIDSYIFMWENTEVIWIENMLLKDIEIWSWYVYKMKVFSLAMKI